MVQFRCLLIEFIYTLEFIIASRIALNTIPLRCPDSISTKELDGAAESVNGKIFVRAFLRRSPENFLCKETNPFDIGAGIALRVSANAILTRRCELR